ncbi:MAG: PLP-dependent aspartate aminotransferase family protein [Pseudomonadota bacterium]
MTDHTLPNTSPSTETVIAQAGHAVDPATGAVVPPLQPSSTFARDDTGALIGDHLYSRYSNPTGDQAEALIAALEGGVSSRLFSSGLAAIAAVFDTVETGAHVAIPRIMYFGAQSWIKRLCERRGIGLALYDQADLETLKAAVRPGETRIVWAETPANPTWDVVDIAEAARISHNAGAILGVDGTCAPPCTTRALALGADISFHSATKYLHGHSDLTAGVLSVASNGPLWDEINLIRQRSGAVLGGFEAWLLIRGMRTLFVRFQQASESAAAIAAHFEGHPKLESVLFPGLANHPGHAIAARQMTGGFGGMLSLVLPDHGSAARFCGTLKVFIRATSLGSVESLAEHRKPVEGPDSPVADGLVRLSIGIERTDDLIADLEQALAAV